MGVRLLMAFLIIQAICLAVIISMVMKGYCLAACLTPALLALITSVFLGKKHLGFSHKLNCEIERLSTGDLTARLDANTGTSTQKQTAALFNSLVCAVAMTRDMETKHLFELKRKMQARSSELVGKTMQLEKALGLLKKEIAGHKQSEAELQASEEQFRRLSESSPIGIFLVNASGETMYMNPALSAIFDAGPKQDGKNGQHKTPLPSEAAAMIENWFQNVFSGKEFSHETRIWTQHGGIRWIRVSAARMAAHDNKINGYVGTVEDITTLKLMEQALRQAHDALEIEVANRTSELVSTNLKLTNEIEERKRGEYALREHEELLHSTIEATADAILVVDKNLQITHVNARFADIFQVPAALMAAREYPEVLSFMAGGIRESDSFLQEANKLCQSSKISFDTLFFRDGRVVDQYSSPLASGEETMGRVWSFRDVTATKMLESHLIRSERLAATGQLAASVAHEINSPLQAITMMLATLKRERPDDQQLGDRLDLLKGAFLNIRNTVKNLLDLNRPGKNARQRTDINNVIEMTMGLSRSFLKQHKVRFILKLDKNLPKIMASPQQMSQVILNLVNNAAEAMAQTKGGKITIQTEILGPDIIIRVTDTGPGISKQELNRIFDPFYTRKKTMGMGVGLSICHGIIEELNGAITADNAPDAGSVFTITLPTG